MKVIVQYRKQLDLKKVSELSEILDATTSEINDKVGAEFVKSIRIIFDKDEKKVNKNDDSTQQDKN